MASVTHSYDVDYKLSDGTTKSAGVLTVRDGEDGVTPVITMTATAEFGGNTYDIPVTKSGTDELPSYKLDFTNVIAAMPDYVMDNIKLSVNGVSVSLNDFAIYAPISYGGEGYIPVSQGEGKNPQWQAPIIKTINGSTEVGKDIYAPTGSGNDGQILQSNGSDNPPTWIDSSLNLYAHNIYITGDNGNDIAYLTIVNTSSESFTLQTFVDYLANASELSATGHVDSDDGIGMIYKLSVSGSTQIRYDYIYNDRSMFTTDSISSSTIHLYDRIVKI